MTSAFSEPPDAAGILARATQRRAVVRPAPRREPPFDDELVAIDPVTSYDRPLPFEDTRPALHLAPIPVRRAQPDPVYWSRRLLVGIIEAAGRRRPLGQLSTLLSPSVAHGLRAEFERAETTRRPHWTSTAAVRSVHASEPADGVAEIAATLRAGDRVHAVALRLEIKHDRWCCTRLLFG